MTLRLSKELSDALNGGDELEAVDPATGRLYVIVDSSILKQARTKNAHEAIQQGIDSMEAGGGEPLEAVMNELRDELRSKGQ